MARKLYVGNLPYTLTNEGLEDIFSAVGKVLKARVIMDRDTGRSKGFGFVEMETDSLADDAMTKLNGHEINGRGLKISLAREPDRTTRAQPMVDYR